VAAVLSVTTPWRADRKLSDAIAAQGTSAARSARDARDARNINPLSAEALLAEAQAVRFLGDRPRALDLYEQATRLQPENPIVWRALAEFQTALGRRQAAAESLARASALSGPG
jgi:tetratricopeptide (TPR) repeat protein